MTQAREKNSTQLAIGHIEHSISIDRSTKSSRPTIDDDDEAEHFCRHMKISHHEIFDLANGFFYLSLSLSLCCRCRYRLYLGSVELEIVAHLLRISIKFGWRSFISERKREKIHSTLRQNKSTNTKSKEPKTINTTDKFDQKSFCWLLVVVVWLVVLVAI